MNNTLHYWLGKQGKRALCCVLSFVLCVGLMPSMALATDGSKAAAANGSVSAAGASQLVASDDDENVTGLYQFVSNEETSIELTDTYAYNDSWFTGSSYELNQHLATLSALTCESSVSVYGNADSDMENDETDSSNNSKNVEALLRDLGFDDVSTNAYYNLEKEPDSAGCAVGHKVITDNGKDYTLIAIVPRSAGYKQEWVGNFTVGTEGMHEGFKAGRDEILRYVRSYVNANEIQGDLKIWTMGHSRGAALANSVGAFMAKAGADYLNAGGANVSIDSKNVYAYTFATPSNIVQTGSTEDLVFSVAGNRGGRYEGKDTESEAYTYPGTGAVLPEDDEVFEAVHSFVPGYDIIVQLPPSKWDFTIFGQKYNMYDGDYETIKTKMLDYLDDLSEFAYKRYTDGGDESDFKWMTFDLAKLEFVEDTSISDSLTQENFYYDRVCALMTKAKKREDYVNNGYQKELQALAGIYGMDQYDFFGAFSRLFESNDDAKNKTSNSTGETTTLIKALAFTYLAYAADRLQTEGTATSDEDAIARAIEGLLEWATGASIDPETCTVDNLLYIVAKYLTDNVTLTFGQKDGKVDYGTVVSIEYQSKTAKLIAEKLAELVSGAIPAQYEAFLSILIPGYSSMSVDQKKEALTKFLFKYLNNCAYGDGCKDNPGTEEKAKSTRNTIFALVPLVLGGDQYKAIREALGSNGNGKASDVLKAALPLILDNKTINGAADEALCAAIDIGMDAVLTSGRYTEGTIYYEDVKGYGETLKEGVAKLREMLMYALLYDDYVEFDTAKNVRNAATFIGQVGKIPPAHYNEIYLAWMRAQDDAYPVKSAESRTNISGAAIADIDDQTYTGSAITPTPVVTYNGKTLVKDTDYKVTYKGNVNAGTAKVIVTGINDYYGTKTQDFTINEVSALLMTIDSIPSMTYTGEELEPEPKVSYNGNVLEKDTDYLLFYWDNIDAGQATVIVIGLGNYTGATSADFTIDAVGSDSLTVSDLDPVAYTGKAIEPTPVVTWGDKTLEEDVDYTLSYQDNVNPGKALAIVALQGNYAGALVAPFTIEGIDIASTTMKVSSQTYTGAALKPKPTITYDGKTLVEGTDYTLTYSNNVNPGTGTIVVSGTGIFTGVATLNFTIKKVSVKSAAIAKVANKTYTGAAFTPSPKVTYNGKTLTKGTDYKLTYKNNTKAGTATVVVTGMGNFKNKQTTTFTIKKASIKNATVAKIAAQKYTGKAIKPAVSVTYKGKTLKQGTDYKLTYTNNKKVGTATVTITGKGNFKGSVKKTFSIKLGKAKIKTVASMKNLKTAVSWGAVAGAKNYQLQWRALDGSWQTVKTKKTKIILKGMEPNEVYDFRVRAISGLNKGAWSNVVNRWFKKSASVTGEAVGSETVKVSWSNVAKATAGYMVYVRYSKNGSIVAKQAVEAGKTSVKITGLELGKDAWVSVRPVKTVDGQKYYGVLRKASTSVEVA